MTDALSLDDRLRALFDHLGIERAHVASGYSQDAVTLARTLQDRIASMTLVSPFLLPSQPFKPLGNRLLVCAGDRGPNAESIARLLRELPEARHVQLVNYVDAAWSDIITDRRDEIGPAWLAFLGDGSQPQPVKADQGEVAGISYAARGSGPPLLLFPIGLARSQWDALIDSLSVHYTVVVLGGAHLGMVPTLENRMRSGYQTVVRNVVDAANPRPGESIVEVGCGSGAVARWLARHTNGANPLTALDVNSYLLREAAALTSTEHITYKTGDAENIPLADNSVDVTLTFTVMEEVDADRMLAELVRVTRPGGRIGVVVRAVDMAPWTSLSLPEDMQHALSTARGAGAEEHGCADVSLYRRFQEAGLRDLVMGPQLGSDTAARSPERLRLFTARIAQGMPGDRGREFRALVQRAAEDGTMVWAEPYHCAVGVKP